MSFSLRKALRRAGWQAKMENKMVCLSRTITPQVDYKIYIPPADAETTIKSIINYEFKDNDAEFLGNLWDYNQHLMFAEKELASLKQSIQKDYDEYLKTA